MALLTSIVCKVFWSSTCAILLPQELDLVAWVRRCLGAIAALERETICPSNALRQARRAVVEGREYLDRARGWSVQ